MITVVLTASAAAAAALLPGVRPPASGAPSGSEPLTGSTGLVGSPSPAGWLRRGRLVWCLLAGVAAATFLGGPVGFVAAPVVGVVVWVTIGRSEPLSVRTRREAAKRDLPHLVGLMGDALRSGAAPAEALGGACAALPGPAADRVGLVLSRLRLGVDPGAVWAELAADPELGPLGRTMGRAHSSGAATVASLDRLTVELARSARAEVEDRARSVGVRAAVPLAFCLLPSFVLLGIVPVVAGLLATLGL